jgi:serine/threonine protein kinase
MPFPPEAQFGPYKSSPWIGSAGMGEVYRARDTGLLREVALEILPASFTNDPDRLRRFEQQARAVAALVFGRRSRGNSQPSLHHQFRRRQAYSP